MKIDQIRQFPKPAGELYSASLRGKAVFNPRRLAEYSSPAGLRSILFVLLLTFSCIPLAAMDGAAQEPTTANLKAKLQQDFRAGDPKNPNLRFIHNNNIRWENGGARITMPAGKGKIPTTGVAANFQVKGDFQITASFEVLKAEQPTEGYGVGVSIYAAIDSDASAAVSLARRVDITGSTQFLSDRMSPNAAKSEPDHDVRTLPSQTSAGKLRIQRVGARVRFLIAEGDSVEFVPMFQDDKKRIDTEFGSGDIRYFQVGGDAGASEAALDLRLLDLTVEAEELPGLIKMAKQAPPAWVLKASGADGQPSAAPSRWPMILGGLGASAGVLLGIGAGVWLLLRRRTRAKTPETVSAKPMRSE